MRPLTDSRSERVLVDAGSIAYSAVTQPRPEPLRQRGTPSDADAAHSTLVLPNSMRTDPAAWSSQLRVIVIGRSSSAARPSARVMPRPYLRPAEPNRPTNPCLRRATLGRATYLGRDVTPPGLRTIRRVVRLPRGRPGWVL